MSNPNYNFFSAIINCLIQCFLAYWFSTWETNLKQPFVSSFSLHCLLFLPTSVSATQINDEIELISSHRTITNPMLLIVSLDKILITFSSHWWQPCDTPKEIKSSIDHTAIRIYSIGLYVTSFSNITTRICYQWDLILFYLCKTIAGNYANYLHNLDMGTTKCAEKI